MNEVFLLLFVHKKKSFFPYKRCSRHSVARARPDVRHQLPQRRWHERLFQHRPAGAGDEPFRRRAKRVAGHETHPGAQMRPLLAQPFIHRGAIDPRHAQVAQDQRIILRGQGSMAPRCMNGCASTGRIYVPGWVS